MRTWVMSGVTGVVALAAATGACLAQDAGEAVFRRLCSPCHDVGDEAKIKLGPPLNGLDGRKAGTVADYSYNEGIKNSGITWDEAIFTEYIKDPKAKIPGTKMVFAGIKDEQKIKDLIAYLHTFDKAPVKLTQQ